MELNKKEINEEGLKVIKNLGWDVDNMEELKKELSDDILKGTNCNAIVKINDDGIIETIQAQSKEDDKFVVVFDYENIGGGEDNESEESDESDESYGIKEVKEAFYTIWKYTREYLPGSGDILDEIESQLIDEMESE